MKILAATTPVDRGSKISEELHRVALRLLLVVFPYQRLSWITLYHYNSPWRYRLSFAPNCRKDSRFVWMWRIIGSTISSRNTKYRRHFDEAQPLHILAFNQRLGQWKNKGKYLKILTTGDERIKMSSGILWMLHCSYHLNMIWTGLYRLIPFLHRHRIKWNTKLFIRWSLLASIWSTRKVLDNLR